MIAVLVGYQRHIDLIRILTDGPEPVRQRPGTKSAVDQHAGRVGPDERRVTPTSTAQDGNSYRHSKKSKQAIGV